GVPLPAGIRQVLDGLTAADAADIYEAIRLANPGGLGRTEQMDVAAAPPADLRAAMALAQDRDLVARQYVNGFEDVFERVVPWLQAGRSASWTLTTSIVHTHVQMMACVPDSLIARKCGSEIARQAQQRACRVLEAGSPGEEDYERELGELDFWLRSDGHRRNPGTTADLVAAGLFAGLRDRQFPPPWL
ncbi:MAG: triphosphoribosyl-dephospho-CoA synthase, partial [Pirellulaceae bacterium]